MECPNCTFQNIPGTRSCVRCATMLDLSGVDIDPPRASSGRMGRQARAATISARARFQGAAVDVGRAFRLPQLSALGAPHAARALVPGLPQIWSPVRALRALGWLILALWAAMLLLALLTVGSGVSALLTFGAISVHCFSVSLMLAPEMEHTPLLMRLLLGISLYFLVMLVVYVPGYVVVGNLAAVVPVAGIRSNPVIANGDVLLRTEAWTRPERFVRGDLVLVTVDRIGPIDGYYIPQGFNIDRVIAGPGDTVRIRAGVLTVNDQPVPAELGPVGTVNQFPDCEFAVADHELAVLPSALMLGGPGGYGGNAVGVLHRRPAIVAQLTLRTPADVVGRVFFRLRPWSRVGVPSGESE